jgi:hypothetical protein
MLRYLHGEVFMLVFPEEHHLTKKSVRRHLTSHAGRGGGRVLFYISVAPGAPSVWAAIVCIQSYCLPWSASFMLIFGEL